MVSVLGCSSGFLPSTTGYQRRHSRRENTTGGSDLTMHVRTESLISVVTWVELQTEQSRSCSQFGCLACEHTFQGTAVKTTADGTRQLQ